MRGLRLMTNAPFSVEDGALVMSLYGLQSVAQKYTFT